MSESLAHAPLGKESSYCEHYDPKLLFPIPRQLKRDEIQLPNPIPFKGFDIWNAFEISWLNKKGKPLVAIGEFYIPCDSSHIVESKSLKLYLNSFNQTQFSDIIEVKNTITEDLCAATGGLVEVKLFTLSNYHAHSFMAFPGTCLDDLDITVTDYLPNQQLLTTTKTQTSETLYSHLLKSNCLVTGQPDWASVIIRYHGPKINHEQLLRYLIAFRRYNEFHEQCVERIYNDIWRQCNPVRLTVYARYTRRGGIDINPFRSNFEDHYDNIRSHRQ